MFGVSLGHPVGRRGTLCHMAKEVNVSLRISESAKEYVDKVALDEGRTASDVMRRFMAAGARLHQEEAGKR